MDIIKPYLAGIKIEIKPVTAESMIEAVDEKGNPIFKGGKKYVEKIESNEYVQKTRKLEKNGVIDFLEKKYQLPK